MKRMDKGNFQHARPRHAAQHAVAGIDAEFEFFGWHVCFPLVDLCSSSKNEMSWVLASSFEMPAAPAPQDEEAGVRLKRPSSWSRRHR